ncbi:hypothetical protein ACLOJK_028380 [Asimina triloba]
MQASGQHRIATGSGQKHAWAGGQPGSPDPGLVGDGDEDNDDVGVMWAVMESLCRQ